MNDFKPLGQQISEQMRAYTAKSSIAEFAKILQNQRDEWLPLSVKLSEAMKQNIESIRAITFNSSIANKFFPSINEIIKQQNQLRQFSISDIITKGLAAELARNNNLTNQFKFSISEIKIPVDFFEFNQSSALVALQAIRHNQEGRATPSENVISRISEISTQVRQGEHIDEGAINVVIQTLERIEGTLIALQTNSKSNELKLLTVEDIRFYLNLIVSLILFLIPYIDQKVTDGKNERVENQVVGYGNKLDFINEKLDTIVSHLNVQEKRICSRDTYLRQNPSFKSNVLAKIFQFESIIIEESDSVTHKWIKVKFIDVERNEIKIGWVPKKYFKRI